MLETNETSMKLSPQLQVARALITERGQYSTLGESNGVPWLVTEGPMPPMRINEVSVAGTKFITFSQLFWISGSTREETSERVHKLNAHPLPIRFAPSKDYPCAFDANYAIPFDALNAVQVEKVLVLFETLVTEIFDVLGHDLEIEQM